MTERPMGGITHEELVGVIRRVRGRWRTRLLLRGGIIVVAGAFLAVTLASVGLQAYKFSPASILAFRAAVLAIFAALALLWFVRPLRRRVGDLQVALYIEEHEPTLQAAILTAVDLGVTTGAAAPVDVPPVILERMVQQAVERCRSIDNGSGVGRKAIRQSTVVLGGLVALAALLLVFGPEFLRQGASALLVLSRD